MSVALETGVECLSVKPTGEKLSAEHLGVHRSTQLAAT